MSLRIGIIGAGLMGEWHAQRWQRLPVKIAGFYDVSPENAAALAGKFSAPPFASLEALVQAADVVQICTPSVFHLEAVEVAAAIGKDIFCEKPLARRAQDAQRIIEVAEKAGLRLYVGQVLRFFHQYRRTKQAIDAGEIGAPRLIRAIRAAGHAAELGNRRWFADVEMTGGVAFEVSLHDIDFACWCMGPVKRILARGLSYRDDLPVLADHMLLTVEFAAGGFGHIEGNWMVTDGSFRQQFEVVGDKGRIDYDSAPSEALYISLRGEPDPFQLPEETMHEDDDPYLLQLRHFLAALRDDKPFLIDPRDALHAVQVAEAATESMRMGAAVDLQGGWM